MPRRLLPILSLFVTVTMVRAQDCSGPMQTKRRILKYYPVVFVGTVVSPNNAAPARFHVTESLRGKLEQYIGIEPSLNGPGFETGKQYLVFASRCPWKSGKECLMPPPCDGARPLDRAYALVKQLRAERSGKYMAEVFGMLLYLDHDEWRPLPNTTVRLHNEKKSFEAKTDEHGAYAFEQLKRGSYLDSADLPPNMEVAGLLGGPRESFDLSPRASLEHDILVYPTGRIAGTVIGPGNQPLHATSVYLYHADEYEQDKPGIYAYQGPHGPHEENRGPFEFDHLPAGDYILVFNSADFVERDNPFHRMFYPHATNLEDAQILHLVAGQQITKADIHVGEAAAVREITVRVSWSGKEPTSWVPVSIIAEAPGTKTWLAEPTKDHPYTFTMALWQSVDYSIQATTECRTNRTEARTNTVAVEGGDASVREITLTFDKDWCADK